MVRSVYPGGGYTTELNIFLLAAMVTSFGIVAIGTAFVKSYGGLIATRVFLGIAEGGTLV